MIIILIRQICFDKQLSNPSSTPYVLHSLSDEYVFFDVNVGDFPLANKIPFCPLTRYFQYPMNIRLQWSLGLFLYMMGNGTHCIAGQPRTNVYIHTQKGTTSPFCETHPKPAQSTQSVPTRTPCVTNPTTNLRGGWRVSRCKI